MPLIVSQEDLRALLCSDEELDRAIDAVESALRERHTGPAGHAVFTELPLGDGDHAFKIMGCSSPGGPATLRVFPGSAQAGATEDRSFILVLDPVSGALQTLIAGDDLNGLRTSVPAAVGARHLAPAGARVLGILGSGEQARGHARMIRRALPQLEEVLVWSPTPHHREAFAKEQADVLGIAVRACASAEEAVRGADVIADCARRGAGPHAFDATWVKPGALAISASRASVPGLRERARVIVPTMHRPALVAFGFVTPAAPRPRPDEGAVQLADVMAGGIPARAHPDQPVVFELGNVYLWDQPLAAWVHDWVTRLGVGEHVALSGSRSLRH